MRLRSIDHGRLSCKTRNAIQQMISPLCGLVQSIGVVGIGSREADVIVAGGELSGVHVLSRQPPPRRGAYHIGGAGLYMNEAIIKALGESLERYSQLLPQGSIGYCVKIATRAAMQAQGFRVLPSSADLNYFPRPFFVRPDFPFQEYQRDAKLGWTVLKSLCSDSEVWVPAQMVYLGYRPDRSHSEPWIGSAVTTGTATHNTRALALRSAILELLQIDAAMGHWYSDSSAQQIVLDSGYDGLQRLIKSVCSADVPLPSFYLLRSAGYPGIYVACTMKSPNGALPAVAVGLGAGTTSSEAIYKAFLEACSVFQMAKYELCDRQVSDSKPKSHPESMDFYDLDSNVASYAKGDRQDLISQKFSSVSPILVSELDKQFSNQSLDFSTCVIDRFRAQSQELLFSDLTNREAQQLGLFTMRVWSDNVLSLCLPSAPPSQHPRFVAYGGATHDQPHPYP